MRSIRKFAYVAVLTISAFATQPTLAAAEDVRGSFTLAHEVHLQNYKLTPGGYAFSVTRSGAMQFLTLRTVDGNQVKATMMVNYVDASQSNELSRLELVSRDGQSFVSSMALPQRDITLRFVVPREGEEK